MPKTPYQPKVAPNLRAWQKLFEQDPRWTRAWNSYVNDHYRDEEHKEFIRADGVALAAYQAVINATSVRAKRAAIRAYLMAYAPSYLPRRRQAPED